jgi:hypothetical protein
MEHEPVGGKEIPFLVLALLPGAIVAHCCFGYLDFGI